MTTADRWREQLAAWAIPEAILANAPESPWGFATECFRRRGEAAPDPAPTPTTRRALEALPEGGTVIDIGVGGGATSLPLAGRAGSIVGIDAQADMLDGFLANAAAAGVEARGVTGTWPDAAAEVEPADVVVAGHVLYNVPAIEPFARALDAYARRRVVLELTAKHPLDWMRDLWLRFHDLERPVGPTAEDARAVLGGLGFAVEREERVVAGERVSGGFGRREDAIHSIRKRLCLPADRDAEIADALGDRLREFDGVWDVGPVERTVVTLWWDQSLTDVKVERSSTRSRSPRPCSSTRRRSMVMFTASSCVASNVWNGRNAPNAPKSRPLVGSIDACVSRSAIPPSSDPPVDREFEAPDLRLRDREVATKLAEQPHPTGTVDLTLVVHGESEAAAPPCGASAAHVQLVVRHALHAPRPHDGLRRGGGRGRGRRRSTRSVGRRPVGTDRSARRCTRPRRHTPGRRRPTPPP